MSIHLVLDTVNGVKGSSDEAVIGKAIGEEEHRLCIDSRDP